MDDQVGRDGVARVEDLLGEIEALADPVARDKAADAVAALVDLYGEGLARIMSTLENGQRESLAADELVSHLLLLHDLHPVPLEERVREALDEVRPYLESHGGNVELVRVEDGVAHLRLRGSCSGCPSSTMTLKLAIEDSIQKWAPEVERVEAEGVSEPRSQGPQLLQIEVAPALGGEPAEAWTMAGGLPELSGGGTLVKEVSGEGVLFARLGETLYAYRPACAGCAESLGGAALKGTGELACPACGREYDVRRAGRCLDEPELHLEPVPLLVDDSGLVKVALGSAVA